MPSSTSHQLNSLVKGTQVEGTIQSDADIRVDGSLKGDLTSKAKVIIGPTGFVEGQIHCQNAVIEGRFEGTLHVKELLNVREKADVSGEVHTHKLIVQSGAVFNVNCTMGQVSDQANPKSAKTKTLGKSSTDQEAKREAS